jgi:hypothetical protein
MNVHHTSQSSAYTASHSHHLLPLPAQSLLRSAAATHNSPRDPLARQRAVEHTIRRVRRDYPDYFREDDHAA